MKAFICLIGLFIASQASAEGVLSSADFDGIEISIASSDYVCGHAKMMWVGREDKVSDGSNPWFRSPDYKAALGKLPACPSYRTELWGKVREEVEADPSTDPHLHWMDRTNLEFRKREQSETIQLSDVYLDCIRSLNDKSKYCYESAAAQIPQ